MTETLLEGARSASPWLLLLAALLISAGGVLFIGVVLMVTAGQRDLGW